jgi:hypothetical protein
MHLIRRGKDNGQAARPNVSGIEEAPLLPEA